MTIQTKIICDYCEDDLTESGSMSKWRIVLESEQIQNNSRVYHDVTITPIIPEGKKHFVI